MLRTLLAHPLTRGIDHDDPQTTFLRRAIIREKGFLRRIYEEWYQTVYESLPLEKGHVLELGSGPGFLDQFIPDLIKSEIFMCPGINLVLDGQALPFSDSSLAAIVMVDVLHHLPQSRRFFAEAARCVRTGGRVIMIEPWLTPWSALVYRRFHHEPFCPEAEEWHFPSAGPLSSANSALPWIIFERDRRIFQTEFPQWKLQAVHPFMPCSYLVSGGITMRSLIPEWTYGWWRMLERTLSPWSNKLGMFAHIVLERLGSPIS